MKDVEDIMQRLVQFHDAWVLWFAQDVFYAHPWLSGLAMFVLLACLPRHRLLARVAAWLAAIWAVACLTLYGAFWEAPGLAWLQVGLLAYAALRWTLWVLPAAAAAKTACRVAPGARPRARWTERLLRDYFRYDPRAVYWLDLARAVRGISLPRTARERRAALVEGLDGPWLRQSLWHVLFLLVELRIQVYRRLPRYWHLPHHRLDLGEEHVQAVLTEESEAAYREMLGAWTGSSFQDYYARTRADREAAGARMVYCGRKSCLHREALAECLAFAEEWPQGDKLLFDAALVCYLTWRRRCQYDMLWFPKTVAAANTSADSHADEQHVEQEDQYGETLGAENGMEAAAETETADASDTVASEVVPSQDLISATAEGDDLMEAAAAATAVLDEEPPAEAVHKTIDKEEAVAPDIVAPAAEPGGIVVDFDSPPQDEETATPEAAVGPEADLFKEFDTPADDEPQHAEDEMEKEGDAEEQPQEELGADPPADGQPETEDQEAAEAEELEEPEITDEELFREAPAAAESDQAAQEQTATAAVVARLSPRQAERLHDLQEASRMLEAFLGIEPSHDFAADAAQAERMLLDGRRRTAAIMLLMLYCLRSDFTGRDVDRQKVDILLRLNERMDTEENSQQFRAQRRLYNSMHLDVLFQRREYSQVLAYFSQREGLGSYEWKLLGYAEAALAARLVGQLELRDMLLYNAINHYFQAGFRGLWTLEHASRMLENIDGFETVLDVLQAYPVEIRTPASLDLASVPVKQVPRMRANLAAHPTPPSSPAPPAKTRPPKPAAPPRTPPPKRKTPPSEATPTREVRPTARPTGKASPGKLPDKPARPPSLPKARPLAAPPATPKAPPRKPPSLPPSARPPTPARPDTAPPPTVEPPAREVTVMIYQIGSAAKKKVLKLTKFPVIIGSDSEADLVIHTRIAPRHVRLEYYHEKLAAQAVSDANLLFDGSEHRFAYLSLGDEIQFGDVVLKVVST